jgi:hypothetical protein
VRYRKIVSLSVRADECHDGLHNQISQVKGNQYASYEGPVFISVYLARYSTSRPSTGGVRQARHNAFCLRNLLKMERYTPMSVAIVTYSSLQFYSEILVLG